MMTNIKGSPPISGSARTSGTYDELGIMEFEPTLMYGRYRRSLGDAYAQQQAAGLRPLSNKEKKKNQMDNELIKPRGKWASRLSKLVSFFWRHTFAKIGEDWVFLALLGMITAILSFAIDYGILMCHTARVWFYRDLADHVGLKYLAWVSLSVSLVLFASGFSHLISPQAIGSGIPEMKTILRGVVLKEYLTFRTLVAKAVGLTATLGSGMPLGKEGPLVHIASIVATLMSKLVTSFKGIYKNESRSSEMLAAACAVGVSCNFGAPIGGVLFSLEVTSVYFALRNYWRGFFAAVFGTLTFRLLAYWFQMEETLTAMFRTNFAVDFSYDPQELLIYALIGAFGGASGALFTLCHRRYVYFMRRNKLVSSFLQKNRFIYPSIVSFIIATLYFPEGLGRFLAPTLTNRQQITSLFSNFTWMREDLTVEQTQIVSHWENGYCSIFISLGIFMITTFFLTVVAYTLPVPSGTLIPVFKTGAAFGRIIGEAMHLWFPTGLRIGATVFPIMPGGYAIVGAASFISGLTHAISICVAVCEITGQIYHIIPVLVAVLVSRTVSTLLQPSLYDSIIMIKKLPYLPDIISSSNGAYSVVVEDFMNSNIKYIWKGMSYKELKTIIAANPKIRSFPLVDNPSRMVLLGSIPKKELINLIARHIGFENRLKTAARWAIHALSRNDDAATFPEDERNFPLNIHSIHSAKEFTAINLDYSAQETMARSWGSEQEKKSSWKKPKSFTLIQKLKPTENKLDRPQLDSPYSIVTGAEGQKLQRSFHSLVRKSPNLFNPKRRLGATSPSKSVVFDMSPEDKREWEERELQKPIDLRNCPVDAAPFQLVERTSLLKVHSMFSLLGINHAYVTAIGELIGIVSLKELRKAIEDVNSGQLLLNKNIHTDNVIKTESPAEFKLQMKLASSESGDSESDEENSNFISIYHEIDVHQSSSSALFDQIDPGCIEGEEDCAVEMESIKDSLIDSETDDVNV